MLVFVSPRDSKAAVWAAFAHYLFPCSTFLDLYIHVLAGFLIQINFSEAAALRKRWSNRICMRFSSFSWLLLSFSHLSQCLLVSLWEYKVETRNIVYLILLCRSPPFPVSWFFRFFYFSPFIKVGTWYMHTGEGEVKPNDVAHGSSSTELKDEVEVSIVFVSSFPLLLKVNNNNLLMQWVCFSRPKREINI